MKHIIKGLAFFTVMFFSSITFGQEYLELGKDYDYILSELKTKNMKYHTEILDSGRSTITSFSPLDKSQPDVEKKYMFSKKGNKMVCDHIAIYTPQQYDGGVYWKRISEEFKNGAYEETDDLMSYDAPIYTSSAKFFKTKHYISIFKPFEDQDIVISVDYFLNYPSHKKKQ